MVKALRSCLEAVKGRIKAGHLILRKSPKRTATGSSTASNISRIPIRHLEAHSNGCCRNFLEAHLLSESPSPPSPSPVTGWTTPLDHGFLGPFDSGPSKAFRHPCRSE